MFSEAWNLNELYLDSNRIHTIDDYAFDGLLALKKLNVQHNHFRKITPLMFANLLSLEYLRLEGNGIEEIADGALNLPKLRFLLLNENKLKSLTSSLLNQIPALRFLFVEKNGLQFVNNTLDSLNSLEELWLSENNNTDLDLRKLSKLGTLDKLELSNSGINLDLLNVTTEDIAASKSKARYIYLSRDKMDSGIIFEKLRLFPNVHRVHLKSISAKRMDLEAIRTGGLTNLTEININFKEFDQEWLNESTQNLSMSVLERSSDESFILVYKK